MNVCNSTDLPELEIISLLEEQLPVYRLRADTIFGYEHDDWLHTPLVPPDSALDLTTEQIEETLKYFLLCADRVGQMTKTYSDIDAVTRLLEEKERDLELAARIGQSLLKKNKTLSERNELLEEQVEHIREEVSQLRHDLSMKDELLQFYTSAAEESEGESTTSTPVRPSDTSVSVPSFFPLDSLHKKLKDLEEENLSLRSEASHLETETISYEEKEQQLVNDCVKELRDANLQMSTLAEELARKTEDASRQQEEITHLLSQIVDLQKKSKSYAVENEELTQHLGAAKDAQRQLTAELRELEDKYAECMEMLHEAQEELKNLRNKTLPLSTPRRFHSLGLFPMDSLAAEIEGTMRKELQMDDPDVEEQKLHPKRVFQTVKNLNLMRQQRLSLGPSPLNIPGSNQTSCFTSGRSSRVGTPRSNSMYGSESGSGVILDNKTGSILETPDDGSEDSNRRPAGTPGTPGSRDLEAALRRLSLRRDNYLCERRFFEEERERKLAYLAKEDEKVGEDGGGSEGGPGTPTESLLSLCTHPSFGSIWSGYSITTRSYLPEKLQIVKPLEGDYSIQRQSSENEKENLQNPQNNLSALAQNPSQSKNQIGPQLQQNPNCSCDSQDPSAGHKHMFLNSSQTQNQQQQIPNPSQMVEFAYQNPHRVHGGCRLVVLSGLSPPQPQLRAPLALVASLLELLEQQGGGSATLHAWQQLAQPHLGGLLDPRPGVVTKGFRTLDHDQEDQDEGSWHLDQPEEDELSPQSFAGGCVSSSPSSSPGRQRKHHIEDADEGEDSLLEMLRGARRNARAARRVQEGLAVDRPPVSPIPPFPPSSPAKANGQVELRELQGLQAEAVDAVPAFPPVVFPGKCMARTSSTYTFTTCRILHPSDQLTSVSSSPMSASCQISTVLSGSASPLPFSDPATPSYTPCCTPRRLSLSRAESSTNLRDSTCTTSTSVGLVRLLLERGISASVYDPLSRDHGGGGSLTETNGGEAGRHEDPPVAALPSTPPNSPIPRRRCQSASSPSAPPSFRFGPSCDELPYSETFLASRPACVILREVLGEAEKDCGEDGATDGEVANLRLVDKLKRFRTLSARGGATSSAALLAPFGPSGLGTGGLPVLNAGLRRNRSYPAMVGASMAMKDPGGPPSTDIDINILIPHTLQTHHAGMHIHTTHTLHTKDAHAPQQTLTPHTAEHFSQPGDGQSLSRQSSYYHNDGTVKRKDLKN